MKKFSYTGILSALLLGGCGEDYLNVAPEHFQDAGNYFQTDDQFIQAVTGAYGPLQGLYTGPFWRLGEMRSDNTSYQYNSGDRSGFPSEELDEFRELDDNTFVYSFFNGHYNGIARCNVVMDNLQDADISQEVSDQVTGEASFLRAFYYFNLVRCFEEIPLVTRQAVTPDEAFDIADRRPASEVYELIMADAERAAGLLPVAYERDQDRGRATRGAAQILLADVYMTLGRFDEATALLREVQTAGTYGLLPDYSSLYTLAGKNSEESVFEIQYTDDPGLGQSSDFSYRFAPFNAGTEVTGFELYAGAGSGWNVPTQDMLDAYEEGDERLEASIGLEFTGPNTGEVVPYVKKYNVPHSTRFQTGSNFPVYRYAGVLLMLAECLNETGFAANGEAYDLLNQVRARAGLPPKTAGNADPGLDVGDQEAFRDAVIQERRVELAFENHRWFDLLRTGRAEAVMQAHAQQETELKDYLNPSAYGTIRLTYQYPRREVDLSQ